MRWYKALKIPLGIVAFLVAAVAYALWIVSAISFSDNVLIQYAVAWIPPAVAIIVLIIVALIRNGRSSKVAA